MSDVERAVRVLVRIVVALLGLVVVGAGALLALEVGWLWLRPAEGPLLVPLPELRDRLAEVSWEVTPVQVTAWITAVAGLGLLVARRDRGVAA